MTSSANRETEHVIEVRAPATAVYRLVADVENWPVVFPPTVHVGYLERIGAEERIQIWATANGSAKSWTSRRVLDPGRGRIEFRQEVSAPPVQSMGGAWIVEPLSEHLTRVRLLHDYRAVDDDPDQLAWIDRAVDDNSNAELAALKASAERSSDANDVMLSFTDTLQIAGTTKDVYDFVNDAQLWEQRLPHVAWVSLSEETPGLQDLEMDTRTADGSTHRTRSVRVCRPHDTIVYKQVTLPALMTLHTGRWQFEQVDDEVVATSRHTVAINPATIESILGSGAGLPEARDYIRHALGTNSLATLAHARDYAESRR